MRISEKKEKIEIVIHRAFPHHPEIYTQSSLKKISLSAQLSLCCINLAPKLFLTYKYTLWRGASLQDHLLLHAFLFPRWIHGVTFTVLKDALSSTINQCSHCQIDLDNVACVEKGGGKSLDLKFYLTLKKKFFFYICRYFSSQQFIRLFKTIKRKMIKY